MKEKEIRTIKLFKVLSNPTRYKIITALSKKKLSVNEIIRIVRKSKFSVSQHLRILRLFDLIKYKYIIGEKIYSLKKIFVIKLIRYVENHFSRIIKKYV